MTLRVKVFNNNGQFDEVEVTQIEKLGGDLRLYKIDKPKGDWPIIAHYRRDGWMVLMKKVIIILEDV